MVQTGWSICSFNGIKEADKPALEDIARRYSSIIFGVVNKCANFSFGYFLSVVFERQRKWWKYLYGLNLFIRKNNDLILLTFLHSSTKLQNFLNSPDECPGIVINHFGTNKYYPFNDVFDKEKLSKFIEDYLGNKIKGIPRKNNTATAKKEK